MGIPGRNIKLYSCCGKWLVIKAQKLNVELPSDPAIPSLGIYTKELNTKELKHTYTYTYYIHTYILVFIVALFTTAKRWT